MASTLGRYIITDPATSQEFRKALQDAINNGSLTITFEMTGEDGSGHKIVEFELRRAQYNALSTEYIGHLNDHGIATILVTTHPSFSDAPAQLTLTRRSTL